MMASSNMHDLARTRETRDTSAYRNTYKGFILRSSYSPVCHSSLGHEVNLIPIQSIRNPHSNFAFISGPDGPATLLLYSCMVEDVRIGVKDMAVTCSSSSTQFTHIIGITLASPPHIQIYHLMPSRSRLDRQARSKTISIMLRL